MSKLLEAFLLLPMRGSNGYVAQARGQSMAQLAIAWVLRHKVVTSALIGASRIQQIDDILDVLKNPQLSKEELQAIETALAS